MKVLFFIYSSGNASGGHFHSLNQISKEVGKEHNVGIISMGPKSSPVFNSNQFFLEHINVGSPLRSLINLNKQIKTILNNFKPNLLHCFDTGALNYILVLPSTFKYPVILNKCGGPNPLRKNYQHANGIILFSAENYLWFKNNRHYNKKTVYLIPNRVEKLQFLQESKRKEQKSAGKITFMRVSRIGGAYEKTLLDTYNMIEYLKEQFPVELIVVGRIQDKKRYEYFQNMAMIKKLPIKFITDERASHGSNFLYLSDFVIGTGRSLMEAMSLGIPVLTPAINSDWPVLVTANNFESFFQTNFSERNVAPNTTLISNRNSIIELIKNPIAYKNEKSMASKLFNSYFGTEKILSAYSEVYYSILEKPVRKFSLLIKNLPYLIKFHF
jgi:glycosyltransferase involved in cell wall biosynthesis